jgi:hypothetical protein
MTWNPHATAAMFPTREDPLRQTADAFFDELASLNLPDDVSGYQPLPADLKAMANKLTKPQLLELVEDLTNGLQMMNPNDVVDMSLYPSGSIMYQLIQAVQHQLAQNTPRAHKSIRSRPSRPWLGGLGGTWGLIEWGALIAIGIPFVIVALIGFGIYAGIKAIANSRNGAVSPAPPQGGRGSRGSGKLHTGPRGGKYRIQGGKKVYIK